MYRIQCHIHKDHEKIVEVPMMDEPNPPPGEEDDAAEYCNSWSFETLNTEWGKTKSNNTVCTFSGFCVTQHFDVCV